MHTSALTRSWLFVPGDDERKVEKAGQLRAADGFIVDLEDAVAVARKDAAREMLPNTLRRLAGGGRLLVRVNALATGRAEADVAAAIQADAQAIVTPKIEDADELRRYDAMVAGTGVRLVALIESAVGLVNLAQLATASPALELFALGAGDLVTDLGLPAEAHQDAGGVVDFARLLLVVHSRAAGLAPPVDSPELNVRDVAGFRARCERARRRGFGGILCIHPSQVEIANEVFAPTEDEVARAREIVEAFDQAEQAGAAAITVGGQFVDYPIAAAARRVLALHDQIQHSGVRQVAPVVKGGRR